MTTANLDNVRSLPDEDKLIVVSLCVVSDRISKLNSQDRELLWTLLKDRAGATDPDDREEIDRSLLEILDQKPVSAKPMQFDPSAKRPEALQRWVDFVSKKIASERKAKAMTQEALAAATRIPQSHISRIESGQHSPSRQTLEKLAAALGVNVGVFDPQA